MSQNANTLTCGPLMLLVQKMYWVVVADYIIILFYTHTTNFLAVLLGGGETDKPEKLGQNVSCV